MSEALIPLVSRRILITGGAGFLGSHAADRFLSLGHNVVVYDSLSSGRLHNLSKWLNHPRFNFLERDMLASHDLDSVVDQSELAIHFAAGPVVRMETSRAKAAFWADYTATCNLLEAMVKSETCKHLIFASTSTVYGEPTKIPTPEDYGPLVPISLYGASKLACESLISGYAGMFGLRAAVLRLANIVGPRSTHGVVHDFLAKLRSGSKMLEVLGDGSQSKSYLHVDDCIDAFQLVSQRLSKGVEIYNVGSEDELGVLTIAKIVASEAGLPDIKPRCTGGIDGGRGWPGDVKRMLLDTSKIRKLGWEAARNSAQAVRTSTREMLQEQALTLKVSAT